MLLLLHLGSLLMLLDHAARQSTNYMGSVHFSQKKKNQMFSLFFECSSKVYLFHKFDKTLRIGLCIFDRFQKSQQKLRWG